jgi:hypothetical protein
VFELLKHLPEKRQRVYLGVGVLEKVITTGIAYKFIPRRCLVMINLA